jgi:hypothetical protein
VIERFSLHVSQQSRERFNASYHLKPCMRLLPFFDRLDPYEFFVEQEIVENF